MLDKDSNSEATVSFAFLGDHHVLRVMSQGSSLTLEAIDCSLSDMHNVIFKMFAPAPVHIVEYSDLVLNCDPVPSWTHPRYCNPPFFINSSDRILALEAHIASTLNVSVDLDTRIFIPTWVLLNYVHQYRGHESLDDVVIPWESWGPENTRILTGPFRRGCSTNGTNYASSADGFGELCEFNRFAVRRFLQAPFYDDDVKCEVVTEPSVVESDLFEGPVVTSLPYLKFTTQLPVSDDEVLVLTEDVAAVVAPVS